MTSVEKFLKYLEILNVRINLKFSKKKISNLSKLFYLIRIKKYFDQLIKLFLLIKLLTNYLPMFPR